jgi:SAM-dependent methyltransferase
MLPSRAHRPLRLLPPREAYDLWAPFYGTSVQNPLTRAEDAVMRAAIGRAPAGAALDIGTGCGRWLDTLTARVGSVIGLDVSREMLEHAPAEFKRVQGAAECLPFAAASFDVVVSSLTIGHVVDLMDWAREVARILRPGGMLVYSDLHPACEHAPWFTTFTLPDGRTYGVRHHWRPMLQHHDALESAGFEVALIEEVPLAGPPPVGLTRWRHRWTGRPVVVVFTAYLR